FSFGDALHIFWRDGRLRPCSSNLADVHAKFFGKPPRLWRNLRSHCHALFGRLHRRSRAGALRAAGCARGGRCRHGHGGRFFAGSNKPRDGLSHRDNGSRIRRDPSKNPVPRRFHFHDRLIRLDFEQRLAFGDALAFFFSPRKEFPGFLRHFERRHYHADRHSFFARSRGRAFSLSPPLLRLSRWPPPSLSPAGWAAPRSRALWIAAHSRCSSARPPPSVDLPEIA